MATFTHIEEACLFDNQEDGIISGGVSISVCYRLTGVLQMRTYTCTCVVIKIQLIDSSMSKDIQ